MKKIYMIWEEDWGNTGIFFDDKKAALEYCQLKNDRFDNGHAPFYIKEMTNYKDMQDYKSSNEKDMKWQLKEAITALKKIVNEIKKNIYSFNVKLKDGFYIRCSLDRFEEILIEGKENNFKHKCYFATTPGYETFLGYEPGETRQVKVDDLPDIEQGYKKAKRKLKDKESRLKKYKIEYVELCAKNKAVKNEEELVK